MFKVCDEYCLKSKNLYNYANYTVRQSFINSNEYKNYLVMQKLMKTEQPFTDIGSNSGQMTLKILEQNWKSYFAAIKDWSKNPHKYLGKPRLPNYLEKDGRFVWVLTNVQSKIIDERLVFSFKPVKEFNGLIKTKVIGKHMQTRIVPRKNLYVLEIVYEIEIPMVVIETKRTLGIDLGLNNLITTQNNFGEQPIVINGKPLKSINKFYNKKVSELRSQLDRTSNQNWSKRLSWITTKRMNKIDNYMHNATKWILNYCIAFKVDTVVIGKNKKWKQKLRMKNFVQIPFEKLINQLKYKLTQNGIKAILTEESYTSKASFIDKDQPSRGVFSGERIERGLYKTQSGLMINADVNGAGNIIRKVFPNAFANGIEGVCLHPSIIYI
jgi:putative transposase